MAQPTAYQRIGAGRYDVSESGIPSVQCLYDDLTNQTGTIQLPGTSYRMILAGNKGVFADTVTLAGSFTYGPTSYTSGPVGVISDWIGQYLFGMFYTPVAVAQETMIERWFISQGSPGAWELSGELLLNGDFATDTVWVKGAGWSISGGEAVRIPDAVSSNIHQPVALTAGIYLSSFSLTYTAGSFFVRLATNTVDSTAYSASGICREVLVSPASQTRFNVRANPAGSGSIDNASLKLATLNPSP